MIQEIDCIEKHTKHTIACSKSLRFENTSQLIIDLFYHCLNEYFKNLQVATNRTLYRSQNIVWLMSELGDCLISFWAEDSSVLNISAHPTSRTLEKEFQLFDCIIDELDLDWVL